MRQWMNARCGQIQKLLTDAVKMRGLIAPASKETRIPKSIYEGIQTIFSTDMRQVTVELFSICQTP